jgi:hypothetical protein
MSEEKTEPNSVRTLAVEPSAAQASPVSELPASDTVATPLPADPVMIRPRSMASPDAILDPDRAEREALRQASRSPQPQPARATPSADAYDDDTPAKYVRAESGLNRMLGKTPGEREFNLKNWFGIGLAANSVISIGAASYVKSGRLQPRFEKWYTGLANTWNKLRGQPTFTPEHVYEVNDFLKKATSFAPEVAAHFDTQKETGKLFAALEETAGGAAKLAEKIGHDPKLYQEAKELSLRMMKTRGWAKYAINFGLLSTGGWVLMAPIKWLEDKKPVLVKKYDAKYEKHHFLTGEEKQEIAKRHSELEAEPKQSWSSVLASRGVSYVAIVGTYLLTAGHWNMFRNWFGMKNFKGADHYAERVGTKAADWLRQTSATTDIMRGAERLLEKGPAARAAEYENHADTYKKNFVKFSGEKRMTMLVSDTMLEGIYTTAMAVMTFVASWFMVGVLGKDCDKPRKNPHAPRPMDTAPSAPVSAVALPEAQPAQPGRNVSGAEHQGAAQMTERAPTKQPQPMASYRDLAAQSQVSPGEPARL